MTSAASDSDIRWLTPPPQRTAYFSRARSPGVVLRVSRTLAFVPSSASAQARVAVAMPERRHRMLSALRSPVSRSRVRVVTDSSFWPASTRSPSSTCRSTSNASVQTTDSTASAIRSPATVPASRAVKSPVATASSGTVATVVTSTPPSRSSLEGEVGDVLDLYGVEAGVGEQRGEGGVEAALQRVVVRPPRPPPQPQASPQPPAEASAGAPIWISGTSTGRGRSSGVLTVGAPWGASGTVAADVAGNAVLVGAADDAG